MIGFGHQWKLVRDWICSRCSARATHWWAIFASSSSSCNVLVDDRLVDKCPKSFGRLQLRTIGRQMNEANAIGDFEIVRPMPPRIVEHEQDDAAQACFGFAREGFKQCLEKFLRHAVGKIPEGFACRR